MRLTGTWIVVLWCLALLPSSLLAQVPTLASLSPSASNNLNTVGVTIVGTNMATASGVTLTGPVTVNLTSGDIAVIDNTSIVAIVPTNTMPVGFYSVRVTNASGPSSNTLQFQVTSGAPEIDTVSPSAAGNISAVLVDVAGRNFTGTTSAQLIGPVTRTLTFQVLSATQLRVTVPVALPGGNYRVRATGPGGPSNDDVVFRVDDARTTGTAAFTDVFGNPDNSIALGTDRVVVQVVDNDKNTDSSSQQTVTVRVTDSATGDTETLTLTETGASTGIFRNGGATTVRGNATPNNGIVDSQPGATLTAAYTDAVFGEVANAVAVATLSSSTSATQFTNAVGNVVFTYDIGVDRVFVTVSDADRNLNAGATETVQVVIADPNTADRETVTLQETGANTGVFRNTTGLVSVRAFAGATQNGVIETVDLSNVRADYTDAGNPSDTSFATAQFRDRRQSTTRLTDVFSTTKATFIIGSELVFVTVNDPNVNVDPNLAERVNVTISVAGTNDSETIQLVETGSSTGIFRNQSGVASRVGTAAANGQLDTTGNASITAAYTDPRDPTDQTSAIATLRSSPSASRVDFTDSIGTVRGEYRIGSDAIFVTVTDADENENPAAAESFTVTLIDSRTGDTETITLIETGVNTGVFRNTAGLISSTQPRANDNGAIETANQSTLSANYRDNDDAGDAATGFVTMRLPPAQSTSQFTDTAGSPRSQYSIGNADVFLTVQDADRNTDPASRQAVVATLRDTATGDEETITLLETAVNSGIFRNTVGFDSTLSTTASAIRGNRVLEVGDGDTITSTYTDTDNPPDTSSAAAVMRFITNSTTTFTGATGLRQDEFIIGTDLLFVTVVDPDQASSASVIVSVSDPVTLDVKRITLQRVSAVSGTFRNTVGFQMVRAAADPADLTRLHVAGNSILTAGYADPDDGSDSSQDTAVARIAPTVGSVFFTDAGGNQVTTLQIANGLFVTVVDGNRNLNATVTDQVTVTLVDGSTGDVETLILRETGASTGIFRNPGTFQMRIAVPAANGILETANGSTVSANYEDPDDGDIDVAFATAQRGADPNNPRIARFTDGTGQNVSFYFIADPASAVFVTVEEPDANLNAAAVDQVTVSVRDTNPSQQDSVTVVLSEINPATGQPAPNTGIFRNATGIASRLTSPPILNNTLEVLANDNIAITYTPRGGLPPTAPPATAQMRIKQGNSAIAFTNSTGGVRTVFTIGAETVFVTLTDADENRNPTQVEVKSISLISTITGDVEGAIVLTETGPNTGVFRNTTGIVTVLSTALSGNGRIETAGGAVLTANYTDPDDSGDRAVATATMAAEELPSTRIEFRSGIGGPTTTAYEIFTPGRDQVFVLLEDRDENTDPTTNQQVLVSVVSTNTPLNDTQTVTLRETGVNTGVFESTAGVPITVAAPVANNGTIESFDGGTLTARYFDDESPGDTLSTNASVRVGNAQLTAVFFSDTAGVTRTQYEAGTDLVFLTVVDRSANRNAGVQDTVNVTLASPASGDTLAVTLIETAASSGTFRNQTGVRTAVAPAASNGVLEVAAESDITGLYVDARDPADTATARALMRAQTSTSQTRLTDATGGTRSRFVIATDPVFVQVTDQDQNRNPAVLDTLRVTLTSTITNDILQLTLTEISAAAGVFRNTAGVATANVSVNTANNVLETADGATIRADYQDPVTLADTSFAQATAIVAASASQAFFIRAPNSTVTTAAFAIASDPIFVRVVDPDQIKNPTIIETVRITLRNEQTQDVEVLTLSEVDLNGAASASGVRFQNLTGIQSRVDLPSSGNGIVEASVDSQLSLTYVDAADATDRVSVTAVLRGENAVATVRFTDRAGVDRAEFNIGGSDGVFVTVTDPGANRTASESVRDTVITSIFDTTTGDIVGVTLFEQADAQGIFNSGIFRNLVNVPSQVGAPPMAITTSLFTAANSTIIASYLRQGASVEPPTSGVTVAFDPTIAKILTTRTGPNGQSCFACHSDDNSQGGLNLTGFRDLTRGGTRGNAVVPGNSQMSLIIRKLESAATNPFALPHPEPGAGDPALKVGGVISTDDLARLKNWIDTGAQPPTLPTSIAYPQIQAQVFTPSCVNRNSPSLPACHDPTNQAGGIRLDDLSGFLEAIRFRNAAVLGNGPGSRMVQVLVDPALNHSGSRIFAPSGDARFLVTASAQLLSQYISQQYPGAPLPPLREYAGDVQPYFDRNCSTSGCHNGQSRAGGLSLESFGALTAGGISGNPVTPGDVPPSLLKRKIDPVRDPAHTAVIPGAFFASQGPIVISNWVNQGAFPGAGGGSGSGALPPSGAVTDTAVMRLGPTTGTVAFTDGAGIAVPFYNIDADGVFITVVDGNRNVSPSNTETLSVTVVDQRTGDTELFTLTELSAGSNIFRNIVPIRSVVSGRNSGDGVIQTINNSTLTVTYTDPVFPETAIDTVLMSTNTRARVRFVDRSGLPVGVYPIGAAPVIVEVTDGDQSGRGRLDAGTVSVTNAITLDLERQSIVMTEVTTRPGVFLSQQLTTTNQVSATRENAQLETVHDATLTATYSDPAFPMDTGVATALTRLAPIVSQMSFTDQFGTTKVAFALSTEDLFVTLRDTNRNLSPTTTDTVQITVANDQNGDVETITLSELGRNSGLFRNIDGVRTSLAGAASPGDTVIQITDTGAPTIPVRAEYIDTVAPPDTRVVFANVVIEGGSALQFTNQSGARVTRYVRGQDLIFITLTDSNANLNRTVRDTARVTLTDASVSPPDLETVILTETGVNTGVFRNTNGVRSVFAFPSAVAENQVFETRVNSVANPGEVITVFYIDPLRPADMSTAEAELVPKDPLDTDDDKIPDAYEDANGLNKNDPTDAGLDFDSDGFTNLEEFLNGTDPRNPFDNKPIADAGPSRTVDPGLVQLDGSASRDPKSRALTYLWSQVNLGQPGHGPAVTLSDARAVRPTFTAFGGRTRAGADLSLFEFDLVVRNSRVASNPSRVAITVNNVPPSPFAGIDQALLLGEQIALNGKESRDANEPETPELAYSWSRPVGSGGFNTAIANPLVTPGLVGTYDFGLTATDPAGNANTDRVFVVVHGGSDHVPLAQVPKRIAATVGQTISVDGSGSADADPEDTLTFRWRVVKVPAGVGTVTPLPPESQISKTNLVLPRAGYYEVELIVVDRRGNASPPVIAGIVADFPGAGAQAPDRTPIAAVGANLTANTNSTVTLDGRQSRDPDGGALTFQWRQTRGVRVSLNNATSSTPSFVPLFPGVYGFELTVFDGTTESAPVEMFVTANSASQRVPVAAAGVNQVVQLSAAGATVSLNGTGSTDADNDRLIFYWHQVSGPGIPLSGRESARPTFFTKQFGTYVFDLTVYDGKNFSLPSRTTVQVNPFGQGVPIANAGAPQTAFFVGTPVPVTLDGSASRDPGGLALTYSWTQESGPPVTLTPGADAVRPSFQAPAIGSYKFSLVVRNSRNVPSLPALTQVTVVDGSIEPPLVKVNGSGGSSATVKTQGGVPVTLDASNSSARTGGQLSYVWRQDSGPPVLIDNPSTAKASVMPVAAGTYVFSVSVLDSRSNQGTGSVTVLVGTDAPPGTGSGGAGDPGVVLETGGGGGGGGCNTGSRSGSPWGLLPLALVWCALLAGRRRR